MLMNPSGHQIAALLGFCGSFPSIRVPSSLPLDVVKWSGSITQNAAAQSYKPERITFVSQIVVQIRLSC